METIILEHSLDQPFNADRFAEMQEKNAWCLDLHGVRHVVSYVAPGGKRMICVFEAPDTEALRRTSKQLGYRYDDVWRATVVR